MRRSTRLVLLGAVLFGCGSSPTPSSPSTAATEATSELNRDLAPDVAPGDSAALVAGNEDFAFAVYHQLRSEHPADNLVYSPYSISLALSMVYAGASGQTAAEMARALHFTLPATTLFPAIDALDLGIAAAAKGTAGSDGQPFDLRIADAVWADKGLSLVPAYLDTMAVDFGSGVEQVDFAGDPEAARVAINGWVSQQTDAKIPDLLPANALDDQTRLVLVNAIHFDSAWATPFLASLTDSKPFTAPDGSASDVDTMQMTGTLSYAQVDGVQAVELPYSGGGESMIVLLPDADHSSSFDASLDAGSYRALVDALAPTLVELELPKFTLDGGTIKLKAELQTLGMPTAFECSAGNFLGISTDEALCISDVFHQTYTSIDEDGTEAVAATAVVLGADAGISLPAAPVVTPTPLHVDHPFAIAIRDVASGTILFLGKINTPGT